ncbi:MAG: hypothetical protein JSV59_12560 [Flavobacteriaceae bacterium]|nr:MAG: hypothetical protein JSV59_12560 [Flavobacteriaceae bacterium]
MNSYNNILRKLNGFSNKYYTKMLVKGILLFLAFGALYFMAILGIEYFFWLSSEGRFVLLVLFLGVEGFLLYYYIAVPIFHLLKLRKGISNKEASLLIGKHFTEVGDKLYNLLDLAEDSNKSELLLASIQQRSENLTIVPFTGAIDLKESYKYLKYLVIPLVSLVILWLSGNLDSFFGSYERVINYDTAYEPPAPFIFKLLTGDLEVLEDSSVTLQVATEGKVQPTEVYIVVNGKELLLQKANDLYEFTFTPPLTSAEFYFKANDINSRIYELKSLKTPSIQFFEITLDYPAYTKKPSDTLKGTGNAIFPEGTTVRWKVEGANTEEILLMGRDTTMALNKKENSFSLDKTFYNEFYYALATSNKNVTNYEKLDYHFRVIKDAFPSISAKKVIDSLSPNVAYFVGEASDDYEISSIKLYCYTDNDKKNKQVLSLGEPDSNYNQFYYTFPTGLNLKEGRIYNYYFEVTDNDAVHNGKTSRTEIFTTEMLDINELKNKELEAKKSLIEGMDRTLEKFKKQEEALKEINNEQKEKNSLNFNDQMQVKEFLRKQQDQEQLMQKFSRELKDNLESDDKDDQLSKMLKERLERQEIEAKKNEKLLEELNKVADKIDKEELSRRLEDLGKSQQNSQRNLEQLLELTKRYYVTEKAAQLAKDLDKLAEKQESLSEREKEKLDPDSQDDLNEEFKELSKELEDLKKDNRDLKKPLELKIDKKKEEGIKEDQKQALDELNKSKDEENLVNEVNKDKSADKAKQKQKAASQKMREMSEELSASGSSSGESTITEDAEMLRQILDNLVTFSFKQEKLLDQLESSDYDMANYSGSVRKQKELRNLFEHIDDSLFALSLRRAELSEFVNEQITEVYYNIDKSLESIADNKIYQGAAYEQYVLNASNSLADFLADLLDNMQQSMKAGSGSGDPNDGFQLPDIIKAQGELKDKMGQKGETGKEGGNGKEGEGQNMGQQGEENGGEAAKRGNKEQKGSDKEGEGSKGEGNKGENGSAGQGGISEEEMKELYEIYKEQEYLKQQLEKQLADMINAGDKRLAQKLVKQMEDFQNDLLENGITQRTRDKMNFIEHELLKLENAALKQGRKEERESQGSMQQFKNPVLTRPDALENYRNEIEILNRQALPLRQNFQEKVRSYFIKDD